MFPKTLDNTLDVLCINFGEKEALASFKVIQQLRARGYRAELYPESTKLKKQLSYADSRQVRYVILIGEEELSNAKAVLKNMLTGEQTSYPIEEIAKAIGEE